MTPNRQHLITLALLAGIPITASAADSVTLASPDQRVSAKVSIQNKELVYQLQLAGKTVLEDARLGVTVDGADLGSGIKDLKPGEITEHKDSYHLNGDESLLNSHDKRVTITAEREGEPLVIELRAFDGGLGFRYIIPGNAPRKISGEATAWKLPAQTKVWFRTNEHGDYSGRAENATIGSLPVGKEVVGPLLAELPGGQGYIGITEADPWNYSGLSFKFSSADSIGAQFKYDAEWTVNGGSPTAWRVVMVGADLNSVMHGRQLVTHLSPAPDPKLYPQGSETPWIKPGRSAWSWLDPHARARGGVTVEHQKRFIDMAAQLGFEYNTVDDGWEMWPDKWKTLTELAAYAKSKNVKLVAWKDTADGDRVPDPTDNYANLRGFLDKCRDAGLAGIKIDFLWGNPLDRRGHQDAQLHARRLPHVRRAETHRQFPRSRQTDRPSPHLAERHHPGTRARHGSRCRSCRCLHCRLPLRSIRILRLHARSLRRRRKTRDARQVHLGAPTRARHRVSARL